MEEKEIKLPLIEINQRIFSELNNMQDRLDNSTFSHFDVLLLFAFSSYINSIKRILGEF